MNPGDVRRLERTRRRAQSRADEALQTRNEGVVRAREQGWPLAEIARELETTTQYVSKVLREAKES